MAPNPHEENLSVALYSDMHCAVSAFDLVLIYLLVLALRSEDDSCPSPEPTSTVPLTRAQCSCRRLRLCGMNGWSRAKVGDDR